MPTLPPHWTEEENSLKRSYKFPSFAACIGFMVQVALYCDKADHHPDWSNSYDKLQVSLTSHDKGGVTDKDRQLARHMETLYAAHAGLPQVKAA